MSGRGAMAWRCAVDIDGVITRNLPCSTCHVLMLAAPWENSAGLFRLVLAQQVAFDECRRNDPYRSCRPSARFATSRRSPFSPVAEATHFLAAGRSQLRPHVLTRALGALGACALGSFDICSRRLAGALLEESACLRRNDRSCHTCGKRYSPLSKLGST